MRRRATAKSLALAVVLIATSAASCGCPDGQSECQDSHDDTHCFYDSPCEGVGRHYCPPLVCEEGATSYCTDLSSSDSNCGECHNVCPTGTECVSGQCVSRPPE